MALAVDARLPAAGRLTTLQSAYTRTLFSVQADSPTEVTFLFDSIPPDIASAETVTALIGEAARVGEAALRRLAAPAPLDPRTQALLEFGICAGLTVRGDRTVEFDLGGGAEARVRIHRLTDDREVTVQLGGQVA